jgi:hypothetical protein
MLSSHTQSNTAVGNYFYLGAKFDYFEVIVDLKPSQQRMHT